MAAPAAVEDRIRASSATLTPGTSALIEATYRGAHILSTLERRPDDTRRPRSNRTVSLLWRAVLQHLKQRLTSKAEPRAKRFILFFQ